VTVTADVYGAWGPLGHLPNFAFPAPQFVHAQRRAPVNLSGVAGRLKADDGSTSATSTTSGGNRAAANSRHAHPHDIQRRRRQADHNAEVIAAIKSIVPGFDVELEPGSSARPATSTSPGSTTTPANQPEWDTERSVADYIAYFRAGNAQ